MHWLNLVERLMNISLCTQPDSFVWSLTNSGVYTVKSMYLDLLFDNIVFLRKYIWKLKVPLKNRIFMWFIYRKELLSKVDRKSVV